MANTLTVTTDYTAGVPGRCDGFTPVIDKHFDASKVGIAAAAQIVAFKVPEGSIVRHVIVNVKTAGVGTLHVGKHVGGLSDSAITTDPDFYTASTPVDLTAVGKTMCAAPTAALVLADHYVVVLPSAANTSAVFDVIAVVDVFDVDAYTN